MKNSWNSGKSWRSKTLYYYSLKVSNPKTAVINSMNLSQPPSFFPKIHSSISTNFFFIIGYNAQKFFFCFSSQAIDFPGFWGHLLFCKISSSRLPVSCKTHFNLLYCIHPNNSPIYNRFFCFLFFPLYQFTYKSNYNYLHSTKILLDIMIAFMLS